MATVEAVLPQMDLTTAAIALHDQLLVANAIAAVATVIANRPRSASSASSELSSVASSTATPPAKRRKGQSTPTTSIDEPRPNAKRAAGKRGGRAVQSEYDVKDRKDYLDAGLYAPARGNSQPGRAARAKLAKSTSGRLIKTIAEIAGNFRMDLPQQAGLASMDQEREFSLPYDVLNDFDLSRLPDTVEGTVFRSDALDRLGVDEQPTNYRTIKNSELVETYIAK